MRTNYILIDYENVQPKAITLLNEAHFKVIVFVGAKQKNVGIELASALQPVGDRAKYIEISGNGPNALDFHIAYYIGKLATTEPDAYFHIISKDTGFDPLIQHLKSEKISVCRSKDLTEIPLLKASNAKTKSEKIDTIVKDLKRRGASKPRTSKTLMSSINSLFQKQLHEQELQSLLDELTVKELIAVTGTKVSYNLPA